MAKVHVVKKAQKDYPEHDIKKGDTYYWWQFAFRPKMFSKTPPNKYQLTQSEFLHNLYAIQDKIEALSADSLEDLQSQVEEIISDIESLRDEQQEKLDNMPDHLQESSPAGQLLTERCEAMESWYSELEGISLEYDDEEDPENPQTEEEKQEALMEFINSVISEIQGADSGV